MKLIDIDKSWGFRMFAENEDAFYDICIDERSQNYFSEESTVYINKADGHMFLVMWNDVEACIWDLFCDAKISHEENLNWHNKYDVSGCMYPVNWVCCDYTHEKAIRVIGEYINDYLANPRGYEEHLIAEMEESLNAFNKRKEIEKMAEKVFVVKIVDGDEERDIDIFRSLDDAREFMMDCLKRAGFNFKDYKYKESTNINDMNQYLWNDTDITGMIYEYPVR